MKVTPIPFDVPTLILGPADRGDTVHGQPSQRSAGLHLSQIYGDLTKAQRERDMRRGEMSEPELALYRSGGFIWETIWSQAMAECFRTYQVVRPGEYTKDGVIGSPDNIRLVPWRVIETKATWKSVRKWDDAPMEKFFWVWLVQAKGYCHMIKAETVEFYAMFVNGDYRGSGPQVRAVQLEFTQFELEENWDMLLGHAKRRGWL